MAKRIALGVLLLLALALLLGAALLARAHWGVRQEAPPLPSPEAVAAAGQGSRDLPVALSWVNTASQAMPRSAVLDPSQDPRPDAPYRMSHPAFVLEWSDGRILVVDVGMTREGALEFGVPIERLGGGGPIEPGTPLREALGSATERVQGLLLTHLHLDHVGAVDTLCEGRSGPLPTFLTEAQATRPNYTTRGGLARLKATPCLDLPILDDGPLHRVPGFPGVTVVASAGHTPGSQIVAIRLAGGALYAITGDAVNHRDGVRHDLAKPALYRWLVVPESEPRQREVRSFLGGLHQQGFTLLVNHDQLHLEQIGLPAPATRRRP